MADFRNLRIKVSTDGVAKSAKELASLIQSGQQVGDSFEAVGATARQGLSGLTDDAKKVAEGVAEAFKAVNPEIQKTLEVDLEGNLAEQKALEQAKALRVISKRELKDKLADITAQIKAQKEADRSVQRVKIDPKLTQKVQGLNSSKRLLEDNELIAAAADLEAKADAEKKIRALDAADAVSRTRQKQITQELAVALAAIKTEKEAQAKAIADRPKASREKLDLLTKELEALERNRVAAETAAIESLKSLTLEKQAQDNLAKAAATELTRINGKINAQKEFIKLQKEEIKKLSAPTEDETAKITALENKRQAIEDAQAAANTKALQQRTSRNRIIALNAEAKAAADIRKKEYAEKLNDLGEQLKNETKRLQQAEANRPPADRTRLNQLIAESEELQRQSDLVQASEASQIKKNRAAQNAIVADKKAADTLKENIDQQLADADLIIETQRELNRARAVAEPVLDTAVRDEAQSAVDTQRAAVDKQATDEADRLQTVADEALQRQRDKNAAVSEREKTELAIKETKKRIKAELDSFAEIEANKPPPDRTDLDAVLKAKADQEDIQRNRAASEEKARLARVEKTREANDRREKAQADQAALDDELQRKQAAIDAEQASIVEQESVAPVLNTEEFDRLSAEKSRIIAEQEADKFADTQAKAADERRKQKQQSDRIDLVAQQVAADERIAEISRQLQAEQDIYDEVQRNKPAPDRSAIEASQAEYQAAVDRQEQERQAAAEAARNEADRVSAARERLALIEAEQIALRESLAINATDTAAENQSIIDIETAAPVLDTTERDRLEAEKSKVLAEQKATETADIRAKAAAKAKTQQQQAALAELTEQQKASNDLIADLEARLQHQADLYDEAQTNKPAPDRSAIEAADEEYQVAVERQNLERQAAETAATAEAQRVAGVNTRLADIETERAALQESIAVKQSDIATETQSITDIETKEIVLDTGERDRLEAEQARILAEQKAADAADIKARAAAQAKAQQQQFSAAELAAQKAETERLIAELESRRQRQLDLYNETQQNKPAPDRSAIDAIDAEYQAALQRQELERQAAETAAIADGQRVDGINDRIASIESEKAALLDLIAVKQSDIATETQSITDIETKEIVVDTGELDRVEADKARILAEQKAADAADVKARADAEKKIQQQQAARAEVDAQKKASNELIADLEARLQRQADLYNQTQADKPAPDRSAIEAIETEYQAALDRQELERQAAETAAVADGQRVEGVNNRIAAIEAEKAALQELIDLKQSDVAAEIQSIADAESAPIDLDKTDRDKVAADKAIAITKLEEAEKAAIKLKADNDRARLEDSKLQENLNRQKELTAQTVQEAEERVRKEQAAVDAARQQKAPVDRGELDKAEQQRDDLIAVQRAARDAESEARKSTEQKIETAANTRDTARSRRPEVDRELDDTAQKIEAEQARIEREESAEPTLDRSELLKIQQQKEEAIREQSVAAEIAATQRLEDKKTAIAARAEQNRLALIVAGTDAELAANQKKIDSEKASIAEASKGKSVADRTGLEAAEKAQQDALVRQGEERRKVEQEQADRDEQVRQTIADKAIRATKRAAKEREASDLQIQIDREQANLEQAVADLPAVDRSAVAQKEAQKDAIQIRQDADRLAEATALANNESLQAQEEQIKERAKLRNKEAVAEKSNVEKQISAEKKRLTKAGKAGKDGGDTDDSALKTLEKQKVDLEAEIKTTREQPSKSIDRITALKKEAISLKAVEAPAERKRAEELKGIDKEIAANQKLYDVQVAKRPKPTSSALDELKQRQNALTESARLLEAEDAQATERNNQIDKESKAATDAAKRQAVLDEKENKRLADAVKTQKADVNQQEKAPVVVNRDALNELESAQSAIEARRIKEQSDATAAANLVDQIASTSALKDAEASENRSRLDREIADLDRALEEQERLLIAAAANKKVIADRSVLDALNARKRELETERENLDTTDADQSKEVDRLGKQLKSDDTESKRQEKAREKDLKRVDETVAERRADVEKAQGAPVEVDTDRLDQAKSSLSTAQQAKANDDAAQATLDAAESSRKIAETASKSELALKKNQYKEDLRLLNEKLEKEEQLLIQSAADKKVVADRSRLEELQGQQKALTDSLAALDQEAAALDGGIAVDPKQVKKIKSESEAKAKADKAELEGIQKKKQALEEQYKIESERPAEFDGAEQSSIETQLKAARKRATEIDVKSSNLSIDEQATAQTEADRTQSADALRQQQVETIVNLQSLADQQNEIIAKSIAEQKKTADRGRLEELQAQRQAAEDRLAILNSQSSELASEIAVDPKQAKLDKANADAKIKANEAELEGIQKRKRALEEQYQVESNRPAEFDSKEQDNIDAQLKAARKRATDIDVKSSNLSIDTQASDQAEADRVRAANAVRQQQTQALTELESFVEQQNAILAQSADDQTETADRGRLNELEAQRQAAADRLAILDGQAAELSSSIAVDPKQAKQDEATAKAKAKSDAAGLEAIEKKKKGLEEQYQVESDRPADFDTTEQANLEAQLKAARKRSTDLDTKSSNLTIDEQATENTEANRSRAVAELKRQQAETIADLQSLADQENAILAQSVEDQKRTADRGRLEELQAQRQAVEDRLAILNGQATELSDDIKGDPARVKQADIDRKALEKSNQSELAGIKAKTAALEDQYAVEAARPAPVDETRKNELLGDLEREQGGKATRATEIAALDETASVDTRNESTRRAELVAKKAIQDQELRNLEGFINEQKALLIQSANDQKVIADRSLLDQLENDRKALLAERQRLDQEIESADNLAAKQVDDGKEAKAESGRQDKRDKDTNKQLNDRIATEQSKFDAEAAKPAPIDRTRLEALQKELGGLETKQQTDDTAETELDNQIKAAAKTAAADKVAAANEKAQLDERLKNLEIFLRQQQALLDKATAEQRAPILDEINKQESLKDDLQQQKRDLDLETAQGAERLQSLRDQGAQLKDVFKANRDARKKESDERRADIATETKRLAQEDKRKPIKASEELIRLQSLRSKVVADEKTASVEDAKSAATGAGATAENKAADDAAKIRTDNYKNSIKAIDDLIAKQKELNKVSLQERIAPIRQRIENSAKQIFSLGKQKAAQSTAQSTAREESTRLGQEATNTKTAATERDGRFARVIGRTKRAIGIEDKAVKAADAVIPEQDQTKVNELQAQADKLRSEKRRNDTISAIREERRLKLEGTQAEINEAAALRRNAYKQALTDLKTQIAEQQQLIRVATKAGGPVDRTKLNALEAEKTNLQSEQRSLNREDTGGATRLKGLKDSAGDILNELKAFDEAGAQASTFAGKIAIVAEQIQEVRKAGLSAAIAGNEAAQQQEIAAAQAITAAKKKELANQLVNLNEQIAKEKALRDKGAGDAVKLAALEGQRTTTRQQLKVAAGPPPPPPKGSNLARLQSEGGALKSKLAGIEESEARTKGIQKNLETIANGARNSISSISQLAFEFNNVVQAAQSFALVGRNIYDAFIGSNERLNQQLLASQTNLASSTRIFEGGVEIKNPLSRQIQATREDLKDTLKQLEQDTLELVGVTSQDVNELFQITLTNASELNNQSKEFPSAIDAAAKLTKGWAAGLQTIGLPLFQARQEINSILRGTIDQNSVLAKTIGISNQQVKEWKAQGVLVDRLNERMQVYVAGNKIAAYSITGITSNIQDLVQIVGREAGEPLIDPLVQALGRFFDYLQNGREEIIGFFNTLTTIVGTAGSQLGDAFAPLGESLVGIGEDAGPIALKALEGLLAVFVNALTAISPLINLIAKVAEVLADFATTDLGGIVVQVGAAALALQTLSNISAVLAVKTFPSLIASLLQFGTTSVTVAGTTTALRTSLTAISATSALVSQGLGAVGAAAATAAAGGIPGMILAAKGLIASLSAVALTAVPLVATLGALAAAGGLVFIVKGTADLKKVNEELDVYDEQVASLGDRSLDLAGKMKSLGKAQKDGTITPDQLAQLNKYRGSSKLVTAEIDEKIAALKELSLTDEAQSGRAKIQIADLERQKDLLAKSTGGITLQGKELDVLGTSYEQLQQKAENADRIIASEGGGKVDVFKAGIDAKIDLINQQVQAGQLSVDEGRKQLEAIAGNKKVEVDQQQKANDAITAIRKIATDQQLADIKTSQAATAAALASGQIDAVEAEKRNTAAKRAELTTQLDDVKRQIIDEKAAIATGRGSKVKLASLTSDRGALEAQLVQEQAESEKRAQEARLKVVEDAGQKRVALASLVETNVSARIAKQLANGAISSQQAEGLKLEATEKRIAAELAAEQDKLKALQNAAPLANQQDEADRQNKIIESQKKIAESQAAIEDSKVKRSAAAYAEVQRIAEKSANDITATEKQQEIATQELITAGAISKEDAELRKLNATKTRIAAELALEAANRAAIDASGLNPEEKEKAKRESFNKTAQLQLDALQNQAATEQQIREKSIAALAAIEESKNLEIQSKLNDGLISTQDAEAQKLQATKDRIEAEIALEEAALQEKLKADLTPDQADAIRAESAKKTSQLRLSLLQNEASIEEGIRAKSIAAIERESKLKITAIEASTIALQGQIQALAPQEAAVNRVNASLDRQAKILQGNASLTNAINNLSQVRTSGNIGILDKAQSIKSQADSEQDPEKKAKLEQILASIGINAATTELELIKQKQAEENKAAQLKMEALQAEQAQAKAQLEIQLRQQDLAIKLEQISARRALIEAQISSAKAQQALLDAQAAKEKAGQIKDPAERAQAQKEADNAIANAKLGVEAAGQQTDLAKEQSSIANQAAEDQKASAIEQRKLLAVQQDTQTNQLGIDERQRRIDQSVALVNAGGNPLSLQEINSANDLITQQSDLTAQAIKEQLEKINAGKGVADRLPSGQNPGDIVDLGVTSADSLVTAQDRLEESTLALADKFDGLTGKKQGDGKPIPVKVDGEIKTASPSAGKGLNDAIVRQQDAFTQEIANAKKRGDNRAASELEILQKERKAKELEVQGQVRIGQAKVKAGQAQPALEQPQKPKDALIPKTDRSEIARLQTIIDSADTSKKARAAAQAKIDPLRLAARQEDQASKRAQGLGEFQQGVKDRPLTLSQQEGQIDQARRAAKPTAKTALEHLQNQKEMGDIAVERDRIKAQKVRENLSSTPEEIAAADKFAANSAAVYNASILKAAKQFGINAADAPQVDAKGGPGRNALIPKPEADKAASSTEPTKELPKALAEEIAKKDQKTSSPQPTDQTESNPMASFIASLQAATDAIQSFTNAVTNASGSSAKALPVVKLAGARLLGGDVAGGSSYLGGEGGAELLALADGSSQMIGVGGPEIFTPRSSGYVYTAQETAQMMRFSSPQSPAMPSVVVQKNSNADVVRELKRLQAIVAAQPTPRSDTNNFVLSDNNSNVFGMVTEALSALHNKRR